jgi:SAM-dependent methyltransferase
MLATVLHHPSRLRARFDERRELADLHRRMGRLLGAAARHPANLVERRCPVCAASEPRPEPSLRGPVYAFHRCRRCSMIYAPRILAPEVVRRRFAGTPLQRAYRELLRAGADPAAYAPLVERLAALAPATDAALDVGCGFGALLAALSSRFDQALGLELDTEIAAAARRAYRVEVGSERLEELGADGSFALVTMNQILEHIDDPRPMMAAARRLLAPGGVLWISVPQGASLGMALRRGRHPTVATHMHVNLFDAGSLRALVERAGLRVELLTSDDDPDLAWPSPAMLVVEKALRLGLGRTGVLSRGKRGAHLELVARRAAR